MDKRFYRLELRLCGIVNQGHGVALDGSRSICSHLCARQTPASVSYVFAVSLKRKAMLTSPPVILRTDAPNALRYTIAARCQEFRAEFGAELVASIIDAFIPDVQQRLVALSAAVQTHDAQAIAREAHGLKGSCLNLGAQRLGELCRALEEAGKGSDWHALPPLVDELQDLWESICPYVEAEKFAS